MREFLGIKNLSIIDASGYEGADIIHDLNEPVPENLHGRFDAVILFTSVPLQSDYVALWNAGETPHQPTGAKKILKRIFENLPFFLQAKILGYREKRNSSFSNKQFYKKL